MEIKPTVEALIKDTFHVAKFIGERAVGGAWGLLARQVHFPHETKPANIQVYTPDNIIKGEE